MYVNQLVPRSKKTGLHIFSQMDKNDPGLGEYDDLPNRISLFGIWDDTNAMALPTAVYKKGGIAYVEVWYWSFLLLNVLQDT